MSLSSLGFGAFVQHPLLGFVGVARSLRWSSYDQTEVCVPYSNSPGQVTERSHAASRCDSVLVVSCAPISPVRIRPGPRLFSQALGCGCSAESPTSESAVLGLNHVVTSAGGSRKTPAEAGLGRSALRSGRSILACCRYSLLAPA